MSMNIMNIPIEPLVLVGKDLSLQEIYNLSQISKFGEMWANRIFDFFAQKILCSEASNKERLSELKQLQKILSINLLKSIHNDIDKIRDGVFSQGRIVMVYEQGSYTPFFLDYFSHVYLNQIVGCEKIVEEYTKVVRTPELIYNLRMINHLRDENKLILTQTSSNSIGNIPNEILIEGLKKSSQIFFSKLYSRVELVDLSDERLKEKSEANKYVNKFSLIVIEKELMNCRMVVQHLLKKAGFDKKTTYLNISPTTIYGEEKDLFAFKALLYAQQFINPPIFEILKMAYNITD